MSASINNLFLRFEGKGKRSLSQAQKMGNFFTFQGVLAMGTTTATKTPQDIVNDIVSYVNLPGKYWTGWYVGIASDPRSRLFTDHNVNETGGRWIYINAGNETDARAIEKFLLDTYKAQGDTGGGDYSTTYVYAYLITTSTIE